MQQPLNNIFLTKELPHRISYLMRNVLNLLLLTIFLLSGISSLPACYATKLNCETKNTNSCPFSAMATEEVNSNLPPCHLLAKSSDEQQPEASFPLERYKRLKIEQIQQSQLDLPPFIPSFSTALVLGDKDENFSRHFITGETILPHHHPPPLFLQYQSFLI